MQPKNHILHLRMSSEMDKLLTEISEKLGLDKSALARFLLNKSLMQLRADSIKAGGYDKLEITLRHV